MTHPLSWLAALRGRLRALFRREDMESAFSEEIRFHLEMETEQNIRRGMSAAEARRAAIVRFGGVDRMREAHRDARGTRLLEDAIADVRYAARWLMRTPSFTIAAVLTIALGIGANAAIFSVVEAVVLRPLPYARPAELMVLGGGSAGEFMALRERLHSFAGLGAWTRQTHPIDDGVDAQRLEGAAITPNVLPLLGVLPVLGRGFTESDGVLGNNQVLIISSGLWQRQFGGSPDVIGRRVLVEGAPFTIVGVMPPDFHFPSRAVEYWQPYAFDKSNAGYFWAVEDKRFLGRTAPGVSVAQAQREVREVWPTLRTLNPLWDPGPQYRRDASPTSLQSDVVGPSGRLLWILFGCVFLVLLICCVNVANLLLARATARERELAVRAALGGGRGRLMRQLITESLLLSGIGTAAGIALAYISVQWLVPALSASIPRAHEISVNGTVLAFTALVAVLTGVLFGLIPALRATSAVARGPAAGGTRTSHGAAHHRVSAMLVSGEVALAVLLVIGATLLVRSLNALMHTEPGFETAHVIAARLSPPEGTFKTAEQVAALYTSVLDRASGLPGVRSVAAVDRLSLAQNIWGMAPRVEGLFEDAKHSLPDIGHLQAVTADYFSTLGIPLRAGRAFTEADRADAPPVAIVSESFARKFWPKGDAVGRRVGYPWESPWITIVGIVADTRQDSLRDTSRTSMYVPWRQRSRMSGSEMWVLARTTSDPSALSNSLRAIVRETDRTVAVSDVRTLDEVLVASVQKSRFTVLAVGAFALAALLLGAIGIYGVMSYLVGERAREMGIRIALGAPLSGVVSLVVGRATKLAAAGAVIGVGAALLSTRLLNSFLVGVSATDPLTFLLVPLLFIGVALAASAAPARRAARADPASTLRAD